MHKGVIYALLAALLFGASTPFAKTLIAQLAPIVLAGFLYLGSGIGLLAWVFVPQITSIACVYGSTCINRIHGTNAHRSTLVGGCDFNWWYRRSGIAHDRTKFNTSLIGIAVTEYGRSPYSHAGVVRF
jgi:hypothetical protein